MEHKTESEKIDIQAFFNSASEVTLGQAVEVFLRMEAGQWSEETERWYKRRLTEIAGILGAERPLFQIDEQDLTTWFMLISEKSTRYASEKSRPEIQGGLSPFTINGYIRAAKRLFRWLNRNGVLGADLGEVIRSPRLPRNLKKGISEENVMAILEAARWEPRDYAMLTFLESTGVRRGGIEHLLMSDLNLSAPDQHLQCRVTVREKGEKERPVIMSFEALDALKSYMVRRAHLRITDPEGNPEEHVFLCQSPGQPLHAIKDVGISEIIDRYKKRLFLVGNCSPHFWRHRWCRRMLENGMPLGQVSLLAGHADIKVTQDFYGGFSIDELQSSYKKFYHRPSAEPAEPAALLEGSE